MCLFTFTVQSCCNFCSIMFLKLSRISTMSEHVSYWLKLFEKLSVKPCKSLKSVLCVAILLGFIFGNSSLSLLMNMSYTSSVFRISYSLSSEPKIISNTDRFRQHLLRLRPQAGCYRFPTYRVP